MAGDLKSLPLPSLHAAHWVEKSPSEACPVQGPHQSCWGTGCFRVNSSPPTALPEVSAARRPILQVGTLGPRAVCGRGSCWSKEGLWLVLRQLLAGCEVHYGTRLP